MKKDVSEELQAVIKKKLEHLKELESLNNRSRNITEALKDADFRSVQLVFKGVGESTRSTYVSEREIRPLLKMLREDTDSRIFHLCNKLHIPILETYDDETS